MKTIAIKDTDHWHEIRREHVGGSDIASLFNTFRLPDSRIVYRHLFQEVEKDAEFLGCVSPYRSGVRFWNERAGRVPEEAFDNARTEAGTFLEPAIAAWMKHRTGWDIRKVEDYMVHDEVEGLGASLDYEVTDHPLGHAAMDCKDQAPWVWRDKWLDGEGGAPEPPLHIILQLQHQLAVTDWQHSLAAVYEAGVDLHGVDSPRNEPIIDMIKEAVSAFMWSLKNEQEPDLRFDYSVARDLYLQADGDIELDFSDSRHLLKLVETFDLAAKMARNWSAAKEAAQDEILSIIQEASTVRLADGSILHAKTRKRKGYTVVVPASSYRQLTVKEGDR